MFCRGATRTLLRSTAQLSMPRNARPARGAGADSWNWYTPGYDALMNFPDACCRSALIWSAAERDTGTVYSADSFSVSFSRYAFRQHSLISAPVHPSSSVNSPDTPYLDT